MEFDLETLLAPVSEDLPAGPNLDDDDAERDEIRMAFDSSVSIDPTGAASAAQEIDWGQIIRMIVSQSARTKDLWLAVYLCRAGARKGDLSAVAAGGEMLAGLLERYWDVVHPTIEDLGVIGRKTPCDSLSNRGLFLRYLELTPLVKHQRLGAFSLVDFERFRVNGESEEGYGFFRAALEELGSEPLLVALEQMRAFGAALKRADKVFADKAPGEPSPDFRGAFEFVATVERALAPFGVSSQGAEADSEESVAGGGEAASVQRGLGGAIASRDDVVRAIDAICAYYQREEPTSPVPYALRRARAWVNLDFMGLLDDIAPDSLRDIKQVLLSRNEGQ